MKFVIPPLRLILTTRCNGHCYFCHHEGALSADKNSEMTWDCIEESIQSTIDLKITNISLTGGEPTLRTDLPEIINYINQINPVSNLKLTTNGFNLKNTGDKIKDAISLVNLSISSLNKNINLQYQGVDPNAALNSLIDFPAKRKKVNVLITRDNFESIEDLIEMCEKNNLDIDILFELKDYSENDIILQKDFFRKIDSIDEPIVKLTSTPILQIKKSIVLSIKHPILSSLITRKICTDCLHKNSCFEKVCAVRVFPDGCVSPCLNREVQSEKETILEKIEEIYQRINNDSVFGFLTSHMRIYDEYKITHISPPEVKE